MGKAKKNLERINKMMKLESINFSQRLEKQIRIMSDVCGLSTNNYENGLELILPRGKRIP